MLLESEEILPVNRNRTAKPVGSRDENFPRCIERLETDNNRAILLDDTGFLGGNQLHAVAKIGLMVDGNRHDERDGRLGNDIGGVETSTKADFHNDDIRRMLGKEYESHSRQNFENGDVLAAIGCRNALYGVGQNIVADQPAAAGRRQTVALMPVDEVRRSMDVNVEAARFQKRAAESRRRSLAVGSGNMDDRRQFQMRIAELFQKTADAV